MANLQERNGWFHLQFRYQGRQYSHALDTQERKEAEATTGCFRKRSNELAGSIFQLWKQNCQIPTAA